MDRFICTEKRNYVIINQQGDDRTVQAYRCCYSNIVYKTHTVYILSAIMCVYSPGHKAHHGGHAHSLRRRQERGRRGRDRAVRLRLLRPIEYNFLFSYSTVHCVLSLVLTKIVSKMRFQGNCLLFRHMDI